MRRIIKRIKEFIRLREYKSYSGNYRQICEEIVEDRWNGMYLEAGQEVHLRQFWIRDLAWCMEGLMHLKKQDYVFKSLDWALERFSKANGVYTTISNDGICYNVDYYGADSLPMLLYCLSFEECSSLVEKYHDFLQKEIDYYFALIYDSGTSLVKDKEVFSIPKDMLKIKSTTVASTFMLFLAKMLQEKFTQFKNPFPEFDSLQKRLVETYWDKDHFINDTNFQKDVIVSSDSNIWPYWTKVITDSYMLKSSMYWIMQNKFDKPFPIKYHNQNLDHLMNSVARVVLPNYQGDSIWSLTAPIYMEYLYKVYPISAKNHLRTYVKMIERLKNFFELYEPQGTMPLKGRLGFRSGSGMLWAAAIPRLVEKFGLEEELG